MNVNKIKLLLQRYFVENRRKKFQLFLIVFLGAALVYFFDPAGVSGVQYTVFAIFCFVSMWIASKVFSFDISRKESAMNYLLVPANSVEKTVANLILVHIFINILLIITLFAGICFGIIIGSLYFQYSLNLSFNNFAADFTDLFTLSNILEFLAFQSLFIFGSVYFRKGAFVKTLLALGFFFLVLLFIGIAVFGLFRNETGYYYPSRPLNVWLDDSIIQYKCLNNILNIVWIPVCWILTFFRLRETEA
ncbi:MAG: hypothetical protein LBK03_05505 [Bacteroidales bacterium]|jgi:hypothetical protein|nr:hypothetical protein [Bacteroidales bacterium]